MTRVFTGAVRPFTTVTRVATGVTDIFTVTTGVFNAGFNTYSGYNELFNPCVLGFYLFYIDFNAPAGVITIRDSGFCLLATTVFSLFSLHLSSY
jgi:hypothetical protein